MDSPQINKLINHCINDELDKVIEIYNKITININDIKYDIEVSDIQGPYSLFECVCIKNKLNIVKWLHEIGVSKDNYNDGFISACQYNNIELAKWLFENNNNLDIQTPFLICCYEGNIEIIKWLYLLENSNYLIPKIDIHYDNEKPFIYAISQQHFEIAKWLYNTSIDEGNRINIHEDDDIAFIYACYNGRLDMCQWLYLISDNTIQINDKSHKNAILSNNKELIEWLKNL